MTNKPKTEWKAVAARVTGILVILTGVLLAAGLSTASPNDNPVPNTFKPESTHFAGNLLERGMRGGYFKFLPIVASGGFKVTNASVLGIAGNASDWQGRLFGTLGLVVPGPAKSKIVLGPEFLQEPRHLEGLPEATIPTTLTYFARVIPRAELLLNVDFGVAQVGNKILPGAPLHARSHFATGISYRF